MESGTSGDLKARARASILNRMKATEPPASNRIPSSGAKLTQGPNHSHLIIIRVVPDTDLAGYPASNFTGYRISGRIYGEIKNID